MQPIFSNIMGDDDVKKTERQIANGMSTNAQNLQNYLATWDNYRCECCRVALNEKDCAVLMAYKA